MLRLCALALLSAVLSIIAAEFLVRLVSPEWAPSSEERAKFWRYDPRLGWAQVPNQHGRFDNPEFSVDVSINSQGLRDDEYPLERDRKRRMLVLGDSLGWGFGVELAERFSELLEARHPDWEIINASVSGYGTDQEFLYLKDRGLAFAPDVVLLMFHYNDIDGNVTTEEYWHFKPRFVLVDGRLELQGVPVPRATAKQRLERLVIGQTYLGGKLYLVRDFFAGALAGASPHRAPANEHDQKKRNETNAGDRNAEASAPDTSKRDAMKYDAQEKKYVVTDRLLTAMNDACGKSGAKFVLVGIPMDAKNLSFVEHVAAERSFPYFDLGPAFKAAGTGTIFPRDGHWNARGHAVAADAIDAFLRGAKILEPSNAGS